MKKGNVKGVTKVSRPISEKTWCRVGSIGHEIGLAYLAAKSRAEAESSIEEIVARSFKRKGKSEAKDHVHKHALAWIGYLLYRNDKTYKPFENAAPKVTKKVSAKATQKKELVTA